MKTNSLLIATPSSNGVIALIAATILAAFAVGCKDNGAMDARSPVGVSSAAELAAQGPPAKNQDGSFTFAGTRYMELLTGGAQPNEPLPLVIGLHGHGQNPMMYEHVFSQYPGKARFVMPFGPRSAGSRGFEWMPGGISTASRHGELSRMLPSVTAQISDWITELEKVRPTVGKATIAGFSQGGTLTYGLALLHPDQFAIACPMAGNVPEDLIASAPRPAKQLEVRAVHGDADPVIALGEGQRTVDSMRRIGFAADIKPVPGGHNFGAGSADVMACIQRGIALASAAP